MEFKKPGSQHRSNVVLHNVLTGLNTHIKLLRIFTMLKKRHTEKTVQTNQELKLHDENKFLSTMT
jgi:hypothetical protein